MKPTISDCIKIMNESGINELKKMVGKSESTVRRMLSSAGIVKDKNSQKWVYKGPKNKLSSPVNTNDSTIEGNDHNKESLRDYQMRIYELLDRTIPKNVGKPRDSFNYTSTTRDRLNALMEELPRASKSELIELAIINLLNEIKRKGT